MAMCFLFFIRGYPTLTTNMGQSSGETYRFVQTHRRFVWEKTCWMLNKLLLVNGKRLACVSTLEVDQQLYRWLCFVSHCLYETLLFVLNSECVCKNAKMRYIIIMIIMYLDLLPPLICLDIIHRYPQSWRFQKSCPSSQVLNLYSPWYLAGSGGEVADHYPTW